MKSQQLKSTIKAQNIFSFLHLKMSDFIVIIMCRELKMFKQSS